MPEQRDRVSVVTITCPQDGRVLKVSVRKFVVEPDPGDTEIDVVDKECGPAFAQSRCPSHPAGPYLWNVRTNIHVQGWPGEPDPESKHAYRPLPVGQRGIGLGADEECSVCRKDKRNLIHQL